MIIAIAASGPDPGAPVAGSFAGAAAYVCYESETGAVVGVYENTSTADPSEKGASEAAKFVLDQGARALVAGDVEPAAWSVLRAAETLVYQARGGTVQEAFEAARDDALTEMRRPWPGMSEDPTGAPHPPSTEGPLDRNLEHGMQGGEGGGFGDGPINEAARRTSPEDPDPHRPVAEPLPHERVPPAPGAEEQSTPPGQPETKKPE